MECKMSVCDYVQALVQETFILGKESWYQGRVYINS